MGKFIKTGILLLILVIVAAVAILPRVFVSRITPEYIVQQIEAKLNCRAEISDVGVRIYRQPARLVLTDLAIGPRDQFAAQAVSLAERAPMEETSAHCGEVVLELRLGSLISRKLNVQRLTLTGLNIRMTLEEDGTDTFLPLFESPGRKTAEVSPPQNLTSSLAASGGIPKGKDEDAGGGGRHEGEPFSAEDLPLSMFADIVEVDGGAVYAYVAKTRTTVNVDRVQIKITDIDIDPNQLADHNRAVIELSMLVGVDSPPEEGRRYAEFDCSGSGVVHPFDAQTGELDPSLVAELIIAEGSYIDANPTLEALAEQLKKLEEIGIKVGEVDLRGDFRESTTAKLEYSEGILRLLDETKFNVGDYELALAAGSWLDANSNQHDFQGAVRATEETTAEAIAEVDTFLEEKIGSLASPALRDGLLNPVMEDGRIRLGFRSSGDLDKPQVDLVTKIGTISNIMEMANPKSIESLRTKGKKLLEGLKGFFQPEKKGD